MVLTGGVNLPTGKSSVTLDQLAAAGRIGSDFLAFPDLEHGHGARRSRAASAVARPLGDWSIGAASVGPALARVRAVRRAGRDLPLSARQRGARAARRRPPARATGRLALGVTYSAFGRDDAGGSAYNTGDRVIAQSASSPARVGAHDYTVAAYNVFRAPGNYASGDRAGRENIANSFSPLGRPHARHRPRAERRAAALAAERVRRTATATRTQRVAVEPARDVRRCARESRMAGLASSRAPATPRSAGSRSPTTKGPRRARRSRGFHAASCAGRAVERIAEQCVIARFQTPAVRGA